MRVFIIEDEATLRFYLTRGLEKLSDVEVLGFGCLDDALLAMDEAAPEIIISDLNLPGRSGLELLSEINARSMAIPVVFISAFVDEYSGRIPAGESIVLLEKPVALEELRGIVLKHRPQPGAPVSGDAHFSVAEYVQLACLGNRSMVLDIQQPGAAETAGQITIYHGDVWTASDAQGAGEGAFMRLALLSGASVKCTGLERAPSSKLIALGWEHLLLLAAKLMDEGDREGEAKRTEPELPVAQVVEGLGGEEPSAGSGKEEPSAGSGKEEPSAGSGKEEPSAGSGKEEPSADSVPPCEPTTAEVASTEAVEVTPSLRDLVKGAQSQPEAAVDVEHVPSLRDLLDSHVEQAPALFNDSNEGLHEDDSPHDSASHSEPCLDDYQEREFARLVEQGTDALLAKDYVAAREFLENAALLKPDDRRVEANLGRLSELGFN